MRDVAAAVAARLFWVACGGEIGQDPPLGPTGQQPAAATSVVRDEIDVELLTREPARVLTNVFTAEGFASAGRPRFTGAIDQASFNDFTMEWHSSRIVWKVNGQVVREETDRVPSGPMTVRLNLWAPSADFAEAHSPSLVPAASAGGNQAYVYEVDWVEVWDL